MAVFNLKLLKMQLSLKLNIVSQSNVNNHLQSNNSGGSLFVILLGMSWSNINIRYYGSPIFAKKKNQIISACIKNPQQKHSNTSSPFH